jgi:hypothetical protein
MCDVKFPRRLLSEILQRKMKWKFSPEAGEEHQDEDAPPPGTPSDERKNEEADEFVAATEAAVQGANVIDGSEQDADLADDDFADLPDGGPDKDWSVNHDPSAETWLQNCAKKAPRHFSKKPTYVCFVHAVTDKNFGITQPEKLVKL